MEFSEKFLTRQMRMNKKVDDKDDENEKNDEKMGQKMNKNDVTKCIFVHSSLFAVAFKTKVYLFL